MHVKYVGPPTPPTLSSKYSTARCYLFWVMRLDTLFRKPDRRWIKRSARPLCGLFCVRNTCPKSQFNPGGAALLFSYLGNWVDNVADFPNAEAYLKSLQTEPHPLSAARLMIIGTQLINDPGRFAPDSSREVTELIELTGKKIVELATSLNHLTARKQLRDVAAEIVISDLAIHKKIEHPFTR
jgi:hypothetical protein